jgi:hypothetical protein
MSGERILLLYRLKEGVDRTRYEDWLRAVERPLVARLEAITAYAVTRLEPEGSDATALPYDYAEVLEVESIDAYRRELDGDAEASAFLAEWEGYVDHYVVLQGVAVSMLRKDVQRGGTPWFPHEPPP